MKSKKDPRILVDCYEKGEKHIWGNDANEQFNKTIIAVNDMYGWLYNQGILKKASFCWKDYSDMTYFALDVDDLKPYLKEMISSGVNNTSLAIRYIFHEPFTPCLYSGAIELGWTMMTYRDFDGTVSRSWECGIIQSLSSPAVLDVEKIRKEKGVKEAVKYAFEISEFEPSDL